LPVADLSRAGQSASERYFAGFRAAFERAAGRAGGAIEHRLTVGDRSIRLLFAGAELEPVMLPPIRHLADDPALPADATICVWDSATTGVPVPPFTWRPRHVRQRGEVEGYNDDRFATIYHGDLLAPDRGFEALSMFDADESCAVFWVSSIERVHWWERAEPLRPALHWTLAGPGRHLAHAACVGDESGAILLAGRGGSGKTTTTLASVEAGLRFVADNYLLLSLDGQPTAHSLYSNVKLTQDTLRLLPGVRSAVRTFDVDDGEKLIVDMQAYRPEQLVRELPVRALVVPQVVGSGPTRLVPASPVAGLLALAPTTVYQLPRNGAVLSAMADFARQVPSYRLELGGDVEAAPQVIAEFLAESAA
jgi:hypothetical protein